MHKIKNLPISKLMFNFTTFVLFFFVLRTVNCMSEANWSVYVFMTVMAIMFSSIISNAVDLRESSQKNLVNDKYKRIAVTDSLTQLGNRFAFRELSEKYKDADVPNDLALIYIDINGLKTVNDTLGHNAGDEIIVGAAECIEKAFGNIGECFRIGGDEFLVAVNVSKPALKNLLSRFCGLVDTWTGERAKKLSVSYGFSIAGDNPELSFDELVKQADHYMYLNKHQHNVQEL